LLWTFFASAVTASSNSIVSNAHLITKVYFPRSIIPVAAVAARLLDFGVAFVILVGMLIYYRVDVTWPVLMLPVTLALLVLLALSIGMWSSALNVKYRDVGVVIPLALQLGMFVSPVAYPSSLIPQSWRWLYMLNPMTGIIDNFRASLFGQSFDWPALAVSALITLVLLSYSAYAFWRMERSFADIV
jgi:lipopolysaccharide transport system permease protein